MNTQSSHFAGLMFLTACLVADTASAQPRPYGGSSQSAAASQTASTARPAGCGQAQGTAVSVAAEKAKNDAFMKAYFKDIQAKGNATQVPILIDPRREDYKARSTDQVVARFGEYTVNPEMIGFDFESVPAAKIQVLPLANMTGKSMGEVAAYVAKTYGATHHIPGIEFLKWTTMCLENAPADVKKKYQAMYRDSGGGTLEVVPVGSMFREDVRGMWKIPHVRFDSVWYWRGYDLGNASDHEKWGDAHRVILIQK